MPKAPPGVPFMLKPTRKEPTEEIVAIAAIVTAACVTCVASIVTAVASTAQAVVTPETIQAASGLVSAGSGIVGTVFPQTAPVAVPGSSSMGFQYQRL